MNTPLKLVPCNIEECLKKPLSFGSPVHTQLPSGEIFTVTPFRSEFPTYPRSWSNLSNIYLWGEYESASDINNFSNLREFLEDFLCENMQASKIFSELKTGKYNELLRYNIHSREWEMLAQWDPYTYHGEYELQDKIITSFHKKDLESNKWTIIENLTLPTVQSFIENYLSDFVVMPIYAREKNDKYEFSTVSFDGSKEWTSNQAGIVIAKRQWWIENGYKVPKSLKKWKMEAKKHSLIELEILQIYCNNDVINVEIKMDGKHHESYGDFYDAKDAWEFIFDEIFLLVGDSENIN